MTQIITISIMAMLFITNAKAKPTFEVIADIIHDIVHDPSQPSNYHPQYVQNGYNRPAYTQAEYGYNRPAFTQAEYGYNQRPHHANSGSYYPNNSPNEYYTNNPHSGYYPPNGPGNYGPNAVYDNQGYYKGPPYAPYQKNSYSNGYHTSQYGYKNRGY